MGRRSWKTLRDTERSRSAAFEAAESEREQKSRVSQMLANATRSFATPDVADRIDRENERDRAESARRLEELRLESARLWGV